MYTLAEIDTPFVKKTKQKKTTYSSTDIIVRFIV